MIPVDAEMAADGTVRARVGRVTFTIRPLPGPSEAGAADRVVRALARLVVQDRSERPGDGHIDRPFGPPPEGDRSGERQP